MENERTQKEVWGKFDGDEGYYIGITGNKWEIDLSQHSLSFVSPDGKSFQLYTKPA